MNNKIKKITSYLDTLIKEPLCELNYHKDYELLIAIMLSAQTTDKKVNQVTSVLFDKYKDLESLKNADINDIEKIIRVLGSFRKKSSYIKSISTILVNQFDGKVPTDRETLETFPGVGRKTVSVFLSEYYDMPEFAVDTHVERVTKRLGLSEEDDTVIKVEEKMKDILPKEEWGKRHKQFVLFGRYHCKAIKPECSLCQLKDICRYIKK